MSVRLHIEHLVLDGLPLEAADGPAVRTAVEAELTRLLTESGLGPGLRNGGAYDAAPGAELRLSPTPGPGAVGRQIGAAAHRSLSR